MWIVCVCEREKEIVLFFDEMWMEDVGDATQRRESGQESEKEEIIN